VLRSARSSWGDPLEVLAALGLGRSYGQASSVLSRVLPSIVGCGLWRALDERPRLPLRALVTDVGNDILYGSPPEQILEWVEACLVRLREQGAEIVVAGLPIPRLERLSRVGYALLRAVLFPAHRWLTLEIARERARVLAAGVEQLAARHGATFVAAPLDWYGLDPIHVSPRSWARAWKTILFAPDGGPPAPASAPEGPSALRLFRLRPEVQWVLGREQRTPQPSLVLPGGGSVSLY
jgi:hypothetical protein